MSSNSGGGDRAAFGKEPPVGGLAVPGMPIEFRRMQASTLSRPMCPISAGWIVRRCTTRNSLQHARVLGTGFRRRKRKSFAIAATRILGPDQ